MTVDIIPLGNLAFAFLPVGVVLVVMLAWSLNVSSGLIAVARMLIQLTLIGYLLNYIFAADSSFIVIGMLSFMLGIASWIALRPLDDWQLMDFGRILFSILVGGCLTLTLVTVVVLEVEPWYSPREVLTLGGMIFAASMNTVSLAAERFASECASGKEPTEARRLAYQAALIPLLNSLLAVGLVSLPGMMTGQILSGVEPLVAARYQIVVMCMLSGASGISAAAYLWLAARHKND